MLRIKNPAPGNTRLILARDSSMRCLLSPYTQRTDREREETCNIRGLTCLIKVIETMSQETMPWSMSSKKAVRVNASISL